MARRGKRSLFSDFIAATFLLAAGLPTLVTLLYGQDDMPVEQDRLPLLPFTISEETTFLTEPVTDDGFVDYIAALNAQLSEGVTPENNAEVLYLEAMGWDDFDEEWIADYCELLGVETPARDDIWYLSFEDFVNEHAREFDLEEPFLDGARERYDAAEAGPWIASDYPLIAAWLEENRGTLELIHEAAARPKSYRPFVPQDSNLLLTAMPLNLTRQRDTAKLLAMRARLRMGEGDLQGAWDDLAVCHRVAQQTYDGPELVDFLVAMTVESIAVLAEEQLAQSEVLTANDAQMFADAISELKSLPPIIDRVDGAERYLYLDIVCHLSVDGWEELDSFLLGDIFGGTDDLPNGLERFIMRHFVDWDIVLSDGNTGFDRIVEAGRLENRAERIAALEEVMENLREGQARISDPLTLLRILWNPHPREALNHVLANQLMTWFLSDVVMILDPETRAAMNRDLARLSFVLAAYKDREMVYPERLEQLVPDYLLKVPVDRFTGEPLSYQGNESGYLAYSVGRNMEDDTREEDLNGWSDDLRLHVHWEDD